MNYTSILPPAGDHTFVVQLDGKKMSTMRSFYSQMAKALHFPAHFGKNLDALFDAVCDLADLPEGTVWLVIQHADHWLAKATVDQRKAVVQTLEDATAAENRYDNRQFKVFFIPG